MQCHGWESSCDNEPNYILKSGCILDLGGSPLISQPVQVG